MEPCEYMDSTAGFAAGMAAVSGGATNGCRGTGLAPGAVVGLDLNQDGLPPKVLQHPQAAAAEPEGCAATVIVPMMAYTPRGTACLPCGTGSGACPAAPCRGGMQPELHDRSAEVASLRRALEQCVRAIGTCARAIDSMCAENGFSQSHQGGDALGGWRSAAAALHDAANLGQKALQAASSDPVYAPAVPAEPPARRLSVASSPTAVPVEVLNAGMATSAAANPHLDSNRRFLVASPSPRMAGPPPGHCMHPGLHPATLGSGPPCMHPALSPRGPMHPLGGPGLTPWSQPAQSSSGHQLDPMTLEPYGPVSSGHSGGQLQPPSLLGSFSGLSLHGLPCLGAMAHGGAMSPHMSPPAMSLSPGGPCLGAALSPATG